ncbi:MAG: aspartate aminotransferase family protein [Myxococcota bacterium]
MTMRIPQQGLAPHEIKTTLDGYTEGDLDWKDGRVFGYVYLPGEEAERLGREVYSRFLTLNALDPTVFPSLLRIENEVMAIATEHLHAPDDAVGLFTSGGTESVMLAVKAARDWARLHRPDIKRPNIVLPETAHACFHKSAHYLGLEKKVTPADPTTFKADVDAIRNAIDEDTVLVVGSAVSYAHGIADPIEEIAAIAKEKGVLCHVDGCIGALVLGYLEKLGEDVPLFDFRVPGVTSISMDYHKYGFCPKGSSVVVFRDKAVRKHALYAGSQWTGYTVINTTVQSTRSGGPLAATWAVLHHIGEDGFLELCRRMRATTRKLADGIAAIDGLRLMTYPESTLFSFTSDEFSIFVLADLMKERGYYIQPQLGYGGHKENVHISVNPANSGWEDDFLEKLADAVQEARKRPGVGLRPVVEKIVTTLDDGELGEDGFEQVLGLAGMSDVDVPNETALINEILNILPRPLSEKLLIEFFNELFVPSTSAPTFAKASGAKANGAKANGAKANGVETNGVETNGHTLKAGGLKANGSKANGHKTGGVVRRAAQELTKRLEALEEGPLGFLARRL